MDWDHLRTFETVARLGSLTAASRSLGMSQSTVSRQLGRLEAEADAPLLLRESPVRLTRKGLALLAAVEPMVEAALAAQSALDDSPALRGQVSVTTVGEMIRWQLVDNLGRFYREYPELRLRLLAENQIASLAAGEADIALRFAKPRRGDLVVRRVYTISYGLFAAKSLELCHDLPWLGLAGSLANIPEQGYAERAFVGRHPRLLVEDVEALGLAVEAGLGVAVLPHGQAQRLRDVVEVEPDQVGARNLGPIPRRDLWLVVHRSKRRLPGIRAVIQWLNLVFRSRA